MQAFRSTMLNLPTSCSASGYQHQQTSCQQTLHTRRRPDMLADCQGVLHTASCQHTAASMKLQHVAKSATSPPKSVNSYFAGGHWRICAE